MNVGTHYFIVKYSWCAECGQVFRETIENPENHLHGFLVSSLETYYQCVLCRVSSDSLREAVDHCNNRHPTASRDRELQRYLEDPQNFVLPPEEEEQADEEQQSSSSSDDEEDESD